MTGLVNLKYVRHWANVVSSWIDVDGRAGEGSCMKKLCGISWR